MISPQNIDLAISANLEYIQTCQQPDGSFLTYFAQDTTGHPAVFINCLIGSAISGSLLKSRTTQISKPLAKFLVRERSASWTFNYWTRNSPVYRQRPYPDDLDDTFCALTAIQLANPKSLKPGDFAAIIKLLIAQENSEGGPYRTWIIAQSAGKQWQDVDLAVNCNIAYFLHLNDLDLPKLTEFADTAILNQAYVSPYYPPDFPIMYFISRFYRGVYMENLKQHINSLRHPNGGWGSITDTALAVSALLNIEESAEALAPAIPQLLNWSPTTNHATDAVYIEENNRTVGSPALTAAYVCEALSKYAAASAARPKAFTRHQSAHARFYEAAVETVRQRYANLSPELRMSASTAIDRLLERDRDKQMALLGFYWASGRPDANPEKLSSALTRLAAAGLYGWLAYTIYDDFLDEEGQPSLLPVANIALRSLNEIFADLFPDSNEKAIYIASVLDKIESANAWEVAHCRREIVGGSITFGPLPDFGSLDQLAERSLGHALGPICVELLMDGNPDSPAVTQTLEFFKHYLIARQLNDDVHDWEEDLAHGHLNAVSVLLIRSAGLKPAAVRMNKVIGTLRDELWRRQIETICTVITDHTKAARQALHNHPSLTKHRNFMKLLDPIETSASQALKDSASTKDFLAAYEQDNPKRHI